MHVIGIDIGGTSIKLAVVQTETGSIVAESFFPTPQNGAQGVANELAQHIRELCEAYRDIDRIGVGVPGAMNADRSLVRFPPNLKGWKEEPLRQYLVELLPEISRVEVDNDAKVATLAEARLGAGQALSHFLLVTLGTGVGGGLYVSEGPFNGIFRGASGGAGEFGHMSIDYNGPQCGCGAKGCIEAYLGQKYLSDRTHAKLESDRTITSSLRELSEDLTPRLIAAAMNAGDGFAKSVFVEAGFYLGIAMSNVANLLDVHNFIIGGGVAEAGDVLMDSAQSTLTSRVMENLRPVVDIRRAKFGNKAGVIGAAMLVGEYN